MSRSQFENSFINTRTRKISSWVLWPPDAKSQHTRKDPDAGKDWGQGEKGSTEDKMVGWHRRLYGHEFEQTPGDGEWQGSLACCSPWGCKGLDTTEWLKTAANTEMTELLKLSDKHCITTLGFKVWGTFCEQRETTESLWFGDRFRELRSVNVIRRQYKMSG